MKHTTHASAALRLTLRPSRHLFGLLLLMHAGALLLILMLPLHWAVMLTLGLVVSASLVWSLGVASLKWGAIAELIEETAGEWTLCDAAGDAVTARLLPGSHLHQQLVVLNFACTGRRWGRRSVVILGDMLDGDSFRHLRVRLLAVSHTPPEPE